MAAVACQSSAILLSTSLYGQRVDSSSPSSSVRWLVSRRPCSFPRCCNASHAADEFDTKEFQFKLMRGEKYNRSGYGYKKGMLKQMDVEYTSDLVKTLKENNFEYTWGNVTVKLANSFGFCWGVERAVQIAYEARKQFPDQKLWLTNEIIHNPTVNKVGGLLFCFGMFAIAQKC
ncbi:hypothetical protein KC19_5G025100 [Ceratodon purpureus]|uniref:4-hydroxy-3-methylbut-2-enyl diphosphate reductase n=1 Tax=Ceratodon purpureus TaxID=3225 RepID=A0A8T0HYH0_CERPU|nr:hypothetical protein KC19_5G025100 [Ceratodon purpureus]